MYSICASIVQSCNVLSVFVFVCGAQFRGARVTGFHQHFSILGYGREDYEDISHPIPQNSDFAGL